MALHAVIAVSVSRQDGTPEALAFRAVSPERWTDGEPHALLHAIYDALKPQALIRLHVAPCDDPPEIYGVSLALPFLFRSESRAVFWKRRGPSIRMTLPAFQPENYLKNGSF